jgi:hypothetical protein
MSLDGIGHRDFDLRDLADPRGRLDLLSGVGLL